MFESAPDRVQVSGPLVTFADGLRERLEERGYTLRGKRELLQLLAHLRACR